MCIDRTSSFSVVLISTPSLPAATGVVRIDALYDQIRMTVEVAIFYEAARVFRQARVSRSERIPDVIAARSAFPPAAAGCVRQGTN